MRFIILTSIAYNDDPSLGHDDFIRKKPILVNVDKIISIFPSQGCSEILMESHWELKVEEPFSEICEKLLKAAKSEGEE